MGGCGQKGVKYDCRYINKQYTIKFSKIYKQSNVMVIYAYSGRDIFQAKLVLSLIAQSDRRHVFKLCRQVGCVYVTPSCLPDRRLVFESYRQGGCV